MKLTPKLSATIAKIIDESRRELEADLTELLNQHARLMRAEVGKAMLLFDLQVGRAQPSRFASSLAHGLPGSLEVTPHINGRH